jgi:phage shock protein A
MQSQRGRLRRSLAARLRIALQDLFGEAPAGAAADMESNLPAQAEALLAQAEARLAEVREAWAAATARAAQAERAWRAARMEVEQLDAAVDAALQAGQETLARLAQRNLNLAQRRADEWDARRREQAQVVAQMVAAVTALQSQIKLAHRRLDELSSFDRSAAAQAQLSALRQATARLAAGLAEWVERLDRTRPAAQPQLEPPEQKDEGL